MEQFTFFQEKFTKQTPGRVTPGPLTTYEGEAFSFWMFGMFFSVCYWQLCNRIFWKTEIQLLGWHHDIISIYEN